MDAKDSNPNLVSLCENIARYCAIAVVALGATVLGGWMLEIAALKSALPGLASMKANTALSFLLLGTSLLVAGGKGSRSASPRLQAVLAAMVTLLGLLTLGEYAFAVDLGIDQLLFDAPDEPLSRAPAGRMAVATALAFTLTGLALLLLDWRQGHIGPQIAAAFGSLIGLFAVTGYAYDVSALYGVGAYSSMALHTAIGLVVINLGVLLARPQRGLIGIVTSENLGGVMARRLLPVALLAPFVIGWLRVQGERLGFYDSEVGVALVSVTYLVMFSALIWRTATVLRNSDQLRSMAERSRRQQEAMLTGVIESAMDAIIVVDAEQRIVLFNPAAETVFGYMAADVLGGALEQLLPKRYRAAHADHLRSFAANGKGGPRMCEQRSAYGRRANGEEFPIEASISKVPVDGELYFTVILRDITDRQRGETKLRVATVEADRANNAKSRFLAAASHDLRQPLAALRLYTDVLRGKVAPAQQPLVTSMDDCIISLSGLLNDLLDLSKLEASAVKPKISDFSVFECLAHLESIFTLKAQAKGLRLSFVPSALTGRSDLTLIKRIVGNFIENAIRYTECGGVVVGCRRRRGKVWIEVWDSGIGIPADKTTEIFEEFKQLDNEARNKGSGLGLAIVAKSAALLGLEFSVRSWPGRGSVFAVELPLGQQEAVSQPVPPTATFKSLRVALVEDNTLLREAMCAALQGIGHQVVAAANGPMLLAGLGEQAPDIVVSDYRLAHGETGYDAIMAVRKAMGNEVPAIVITGDTDPKVIGSMVDRGIAVLHKPFDIEDLQVYLEDLTFKAI